MNITCIVFGILFLIAGFVFSIGKGHEHLEGWQKMTAEEKANIQIVPLCKNAGVVIGLAGVGFLIAGFFPVFADRFFICYMVAWFVGTGLDIRAISKGKYTTNNPHSTVYIDKRGRGGLKR